MALGSQVIEADEDPKDFQLVIVLMVSHSHFFFHKVMDIVMLVQLTIDCGRSMAIRQRTSPLQKQGQALCLYRQT